ncbi:MAG: hypothetical protein AAF587_24215 [Bacteroidota bacterium]
MKRTLTLIFSLVFALTLVQAQQSQEIVEGSFPFHKKMASKANGLAIIIQGKPTDVEEVMERVFRAELQSGKLKSMKQGVMGMESARIARMSERTLDYFYKVEGTSNTLDGPTKVSLFLSAGNNNFLDSDKYPEEMAAAKRMLKELQSKVEGYELELAIAAQEAAVKAALKEQADYIKERDELLKKQESLEREEQNIIKKQAELEQRLAQVKADQLSTQEDISTYAERQTIYIQRVEKEKKDLADLKAKQSPASIISTNNR